MQGVDAVPTPMTQPKPSPNAVQDSKNPSGFQALVATFWGKLLVIILGVSINVAGQILLKLGTQGGDLMDMSEGVSGLLLRVFTNPYILTGLVFFGAGLLFYLTMLSILDISLVYPAGALNYVIVSGITALGLFGIDYEPITILKALGLTFIMGGVVVIALSEEKDDLSALTEDSKDA